MELMQTRPDYTLHHVLDIKHGTLFGKDWKKSPNGEWDFVYDIFRTSWSNQISMWQRIVIECEHLKSMFAKCEVPMQKGVRLPRDANIAVKAFGIVVEGMLDIQCSNLFPQLHSMNVMKDRFQQIREWSQTDRAADVFQENLDPKKKADRIFWHAYSLQITISQWTQYGAEVPMRALLCELADVECNKIVKFSLSALALLDELRLSSCWHQFTECDTDDRGKQEEACFEGIRSRDMMPHDLSSFSAEQEMFTQTTQFTFPSGRLLREFCESKLPEGGKDVVGLKQMIDARERLGKLWQSIRSDVKARENVVKRFEAYTNVLIGHMSSDMSADYMAQVALQRGELEDKYRHERRRKEQQHREKSAQFVQQSWDSASKSEDGLVRRKMTKKLKSAIEPSKVETDLQNLTLNADHVNDSGSTNDGGSPNSQIQVKQDTLSVVQKMFPSSAADGKEGGVRWTNFVQAMTDSGMVATQGAGSAITFANAQGRIVFHEPHPEPTVDAIQLRSFGQRLSKWFGWSDKTFVLRQKGGEATQEGNDAVSIELIKPRR